MNVVIVSTGEEVLYGDIVDTNAAWFSRRLFEQGFEIDKRVTLGDSLGDLVNEFCALGQEAKLVIVSGGLGPTSDDLTAQAAAQASNTALVLCESWLTQLKIYYSHRGVEMPASNLKQAMLPEGCEIIDNPIGTACGFSLMIGKARFYFTPGVPVEFTKMIEEQILPRLSKASSTRSGKHCDKFYSFGLSESKLADRLDGLALPKGASFGYRSYLPYIEVKLFVPTEFAGTEEALTLMTRTERLIASHTLSVNQTPIECLIERLMAQQQKLFVAESATCGQLSQWLLSADSAQRCYQGGEIRSAATDALTGLLRLKAQSSKVDEGSRSALLAFEQQIIDKRQADGLDNLVLISDIYEKQFALCIADHQGIETLFFEFSRDHHAEAQRAFIGALAIDLLLKRLMGKALKGDYVQFKALAR